MSIYAKKSYDLAVWKINDNESQKNYIPGKSSLQFHEKIIPTRITKPVEKAVWRGKNEKREYPIYYPLTNL